MVNPVNTQDNQQQMDKAYTPAKLAFRIWFVPFIIFFHDVIFSQIIYPLVVTFCNRLQYESIQAGYDTAYATSFVRIGSMTYNVIYMLVLALSIIIFYLLAFIKVKGMQRKGCAGMKYVPLGGTVLAIIMCRFSRVVGYSLIRFLSVLDINFPPSTMLRIIIILIEVTATFFTALFVTLISFFIMKGVEKLPESVKKVKE